MCVTNCLDTAHDIYTLYITKCVAWVDQERGTGGPDPPLKNHKNIGFLSNTGPDPLKNHEIH